MFKLYREDKKAFAKCMSWKGVKLYTEGLSKWTMFDDGKEEIKIKEAPYKAPKIDWTAWNAFIAKEGFEIKPEGKGKGTKGWIAPDFFEQNPHIYSEQPDEPYIANIGSGLSGIDLMNAKLDILEAKIGDGEDIQENNYALLIGSVCAHLDSQITEEQKLTGKIPKKIGWSYVAKSHRHKGALGCCDDRFPDPTGEKQFREAYIIETKSIGCTKGVDKPLRLAKEESVTEPFKDFAFAMITGYDDEGNIFFGNPDKLIDKISRSRDGMKRGINTANDIYYLRDLLTSEPQFASEIAEKAGWSVQKTSKLLKTAMNAGTVKSIPLKNTKRMVHPAYFI